ncbi:hypothetical protein, partial [Eudoraea sp.]|uniref:hypothetical protein n=1 Tax=Eudoraea sp. TaxID=1979955 RepID=UPI003C772048
MRGGKQTLVCFRTVHSSAVVRNFGAIFDASTNMKRTVFISFIFIVSGLLAHGQVKPITEFDLYGCWIMERSEDGKRPQKQIYKRCNSSDTKLRVKHSKISLLAFNESEFQTTSAYICFTTVTEKGTWSYNENEGIVSMFWGQECLREFKEKDPEEYAKWNSPKKFNWLKFKVIELSENQLEVEKLRTTK